MTCHLSHRPHRCPSDCLKVAEDAHRNVARIQADTRQPVVIWPNNPNWKVKS